MALPDGSSNLLINQPLLILGIFLASAYILTILFEKVSLPHILSYLSVGFIFGNFILKETFTDPLFQDEIGLIFHTVEILALGLIGFHIGTELDLKQLGKDPKMVTILVLGNLIGTFIVVFMVMFFLEENRLGVLLLAALATSTAPAATIGVIKKLKAEGPVTQKVQWTLAFDDVGSVIIVEAIMIYVLVSFGGNATAFGFIEGIGQEIGLAIIIGFVIGFILNKLIEKMEDPITKMEISVGLTILTIGLSEYFHTSAITSTMMLGATVINLGKNDFQDTQHIIDIILSPILAVFFILVGVKSQLSLFSPFPIIALIYFAARIFGKFFGSYFAAQYLGIKEPEKSSIGLSLFAQGGVVLGLASIVNEKLILAGQDLLAGKILGMVLISTILSELFGVISADYGIRRAGEAGALGSLNETSQPIVPHHQ